MYQLPCGIGKSRIAATIALLLLQLNPSVKKIYLVYVNKILMRKDIEQFEDLWNLMPNGDRIEHHSDLNFTPSGAGVVIIDECDEYILQDPYAFRKFSKKCRCICLSGTCSESYSEGIERNALNAMNFKIFEDLFSGQGLEISPPICQRMGSMTDEKIIEFV